MTTPSEKIRLNCYAETDDGLVRLLIQKEGNDMSVWENDDLNDIINSFEELVETYGSVYYETKEDYKKGNGKKFAEIL